MYQALRFFNLDTCERVRPRSTCPATELLRGIQNLTTAESRAKIWPVRSPVASAAVRSKVIVHSLAIFAPDACEGMGCSVLVL